MNWIHISNEEVCVWWLLFEGRTFKIYEGMDGKFNLFTGENYEGCADTLEEAKDKLYLYLAKERLGDCWDRILSRAISHAPEGMWVDAFEYKVIFEAGFSGLHDELLDAFLAEVKRIKYGRVE